MIILSIIIPVYKVEEYIENTLQSIFNQPESCSNAIELIIVNDGTPDNSMEIVENYAHTYSNIQIINQENQGLSCARNIGLKKAKGKYIWFVDSDDTISKNSIVTILSYLNQYTADILAFNMIWVSEKNGTMIERSIFYKKRYFHLYKKYMQYDEIINKIADTPVQRFIFKRSFLEEKKLTFYPKIYHEDNEFMPRALFLSTSIIVINYAPYCYLVRTHGNITSTITPKHIQDILTITKSLYEFKQKYTKNYHEEAFFDFYSSLLIRDLVNKNLLTNSLDWCNLRASILQWLYNGIKASLHYRLLFSFIKTSITYFKILFSNI